MKLIAIDRKEMVDFPVPEPVNFFAVQPEHIGQAMRSPSQVAQVGFIHNAAPISHNEYSAILDKAFQLFFNSCPEHIKHGCGNDLIGIQRLFHIYNVHI